MKRWIKITIGVVVIVCLMVGAFYAGGVIGFMTGVSYEEAISAGLDGVITVSILRAIREGRTDSAIKLLETSLDIKVIENSLLEEDRYLAFDLFRMNRNAGKFMVVIAKYRKEYPTERPFGSVIKELLSKYEITDEE